MVPFAGSEFVTGWTGKRGRKLKSKLEKTKQKVKSMARELYDDHFKAVESMPRGVVVTLRNISTQLESAWELHTNRQVRARDFCDPESLYRAYTKGRLFFALFFWVCLKF